MTSTAAVQAATVLEVPLNPSITTPAGCATQATLIQSIGVNAVGPCDAVTIDQKDGHLDVKVSNDNNRGNQLLVSDHVRTCTLAIQVLFNYNTITIHVNV